MLCRISPESRLKNPYLYLVWPLFSKNSGIFYAKKGPGIRINGLEDAKKAVPALIPSFLGENKLKSDLVFCNFSGSGGEGRPLKNVQFRSSSRKAGGGWGLRDKRNVNLLFLRVMI